MDYAESKELIVEIKKMNEKLEKLINELHLLVSKN